MSKPKIYIDGKEGTTGLQIYERLGERDDIELLLIDEEKRKDVKERKELLNAADLVFLCLPDAAAREAVSLVTNEHTRIIDCSTAHRTAEGWVYGFPELHDQREKIRAAKRVANPGCHATGFLACVAPLTTQFNLIPKNYPLTCWSLTGYSGGGKKMIAEYEDPNRDSRLDGPAPYALGLAHKHLPEMMKAARLEVLPAFLPVLGDVYQGMCTTVMLHNGQLNSYVDAEEVWDLLMLYYHDEAMVCVAPFEETPARLYTSQMAGSDRMLVTVSGDGEHTLIAAQFDNLGKGASGAAVQNMNLMLGFEETKGLNI